MSHQSNSKGTPEVAQQQPEVAQKSFQSSNSNSRETRKSSRLQDKSKAEAQESPQKEQELETKQRQQSKSQNSSATAKKTAQSQIQAAFLKTMRKSKLHSEHSTLSVANVDSCVPKSVDEFLESYRGFLPNIFKPYDLEKEVGWVETHKIPLFRLFTAVVNQNGIVDVVSEGLKKQTLQSFCGQFELGDQKPSKESSEEQSEEKLIKSDPAEEIFSLYKRYLFHYENKILGNQIKSHRDPTPLFNEATFVTERQLSDLLRKDPLDTAYYDYDILVFQSGENSLQIDSDRISLDNVARCYKDESVDIRIQKPLDFGFNVRKLRNEPFQMKVEDFRKYQKLCQEHETTDLIKKEGAFEALGELASKEVSEMTMGERVKANEIFFAVNFEPEDGLLVEHIRERVKGTFLGYKQQFDLLSLLDHEVPGCSLPQFYMKVRGVWTGGHQENVNMCAVNINHGPDSSEWYTMDLKHVEAFRAKLKEKYKIDLYTQEGLWYEKINWFIENNFPIKKIVQKKGDIVISGPGTLHWVRSHGVALQSAWNIFPVTLKGMKASFHRQKQNQQIKFAKSNVIPLKVLTLKLLNHQGWSLDREIVELCCQKVEQWLGEERNLYKQIQRDYEQNHNLWGLRQTSKEELQDLQGFCSLCAQQVFQCFFLSEEEVELYCLKCFDKYQRVRRMQLRPHFRHSVHAIKVLLKKCRSGKEFAEMQDFCNGPYIGKIGEKVKCKWKGRESISDEQKVELVNRMNQELSGNNSAILTLYKHTKKMKEERKKDLMVENCELEEQHEPLSIEVEQKRRLEPQSGIKEKSPDRNQWSKVELEGVSFDERKCEKILKHSYQQQQKLKASGQRTFFEYFVINAEDRLRRRNANYSHSDSRYLQRHGNYSSRSKAEFPNSGVQGKGSHHESDYHRSRDSFHRFGHQRESEKSGRRADQQTFDRGSHSEYPRSSKNRHNEDYRGGRNPAKKNEGHQSYRQKNDYADRREGNDDYRRQARNEKQSKRGRPSSSYEGEEQFEGKKRIHEAQEFQY